jgi:tetratricopeptide (TPR) repeat protein
MTTLKHTSTVIVAFVLAGGFLLGGCGGGQTPPPRTAKDETAVSQGEGGGAGAAAVAAVPVRPAREVSGEAKQDFDAALKKYQAAAKTGVNRSNCGDLAAAFAHVYDAHPKLPEAKFNEGVIWEECGDLAKAEQAYQQVVGKHPAFGPALNNMGEILFVRGNVGAATDYFKRAADQKNSSGYANLAVLQRNQAVSGNVAIVKEALDNVHRSLAVDSYNIEAYGTMALLLYDHAKTRAQLEMARLICVQATKVNDRYAPIYNVLGLILLRMSRVTPALAEFRKAAAIDGNLLEAHMNIGAVTLSFRDYKSAEEAFAKVLTLNPAAKTKVEALVGLGVARRGQRKLKEAMDTYRQAQALDPSNVDIWYNMGILIQDYTFDASNPTTGIASLQQAEGFLQRYVSGGKDTDKVKDAEKRIKNIRELLPMLQEQQKMAPSIPKAAPAPARAAKPGKKV